MKRVLMIAAENDLLPGAKVGGVGDVIRDLPHAIANDHCQVDVIIPSYGFLSRLKGIEHCATVSVPFAGSHYDVQLLKYRCANETSGQYILHHERFSPHGEKVYCDDLNPFATDATKFAFFNAAIAECIREEMIPRPTHLHCHDWHAAFILLLREYDKRYDGLKSIKTVFSIHNIAMQGLRPLTGEESSLMAWFPRLPIDYRVVMDPRYMQSINPMRAGVLLADKVHTVSPTYAQEILQSSHHAEGVYGGEGLESDLQARAQVGDLVGILNGCEYPDNEKSTKPARKKIVDGIFPSLEKWSAPYQFVPTANWIAERRLTKWLTRKNIGITLTSIGRLTQQKARILTTRCTLGVSALQGVLDRLGDKGVLFILGSGDPAIEQFISETAAVNTNLIFLNGYSDEVSKLLYRFGDVFLMPSSFEPCGISQLLAMREGQPCLVHGVGGLKDTVEHNKTGFVFYGDNLQQQADNLLGVFDHIMTVYESNPVELKMMGKAAREKRFTWQQAARQYHDQLYL